MQGTIIAKLLEPYWNKSTKLSLIPRNIIPSLSKYWIQNLNPGSNRTILLLKLFIIKPSNIAKIIGDKGLFLKPNKFTPINFDRNTAKNDEMTHKPMPYTIFLLFSLIFNIIPYYT